MMKLKIRSEKIAEGIIRWRWIIIPITLIIAMLAASGLRNLGINNDYHVFFSKENPQLVAFDGLQAKFTKDDNVYIMLAPSNGKVFTKENLAAIEDLTLRAWQTPFSSRVDAITNFQHIHAEGDEMFVEDLVSGANVKSELEIMNAERIALKDPLLVNRLIDRNGSLTAVNITVNLPGKELTENTQVAKFVRELVAKWQNDHPGFKTYLTGNVIFHASFDENFESDMMHLTPLMFLVIIAFLLITTRNIGATLITFLIILLSMFTGLGLAGWLGIKMSGPVFSAPNMIMTLAIANSIHIILVILQHLRTGHSKNESIIYGYRINFMPVFITSITTVIGFLSLNFSDTPPFRDLGNITSMGVAASFLYSIILLPALLAVIPLKSKESKLAEKESLLLAKLANWVILKRGRIIYSSLILTMALSVFAFRNDLNNQFINFFDETVPFRSDSDYIDEKLTGMYTIEFSLPSGQPDGISNPAYLKNVSAFEEWFAKQENVVHVNAFTEVIRRVNKSMHGDQEKYYTLPASQPEAAQYLLLYEMSLPYGLDLNNQINVDKSETRFTATVKNISSKDLLALTAKAENWLKENAPEYMHESGVGMAIMFSHITKRNMTSMLQGGIMGLILISFILIAALRSWRYGLISLIPNLAPIGIAFGVWYFMEGQINMSTSIVFGMVLGIIVDDTIHILSKYVTARREMNKSPEDAIRYAFATVSKAAIITTVILTAGFLVLAQSHFGFNAGMAKVTALTIVIALILDLLLLPAILLTIDKNKQPKVQPGVSTTLVNSI
jgi:uncharacterized protein